MPIGAGMLLSSGNVGEDIFMQYITLEMGYRTGLGGWYVCSVAKHPDIFLAFRLQRVLVNRNISHWISYA